MRILISGASRGIGAALLASYTARGDEVIGTSRSGQGGLWPLDVTDPASVAGLGSRMGTEPLDLLVCNAGIYPDKGQSLETGYPANMWADGFAANVTGVFLTIQAALPALRSANGKIAVISSQMASQTLAPGGSYIYRASKAAVLNLGRNLSVDLKPDGIAVGIYHPGWVRTDMGGAAADIDAADAAAGLIDRFDALCLDTTGCFETWDGRPHPF